MAKKIYFFFVYFIIFTAISNISAAVYYVDVQTGSDTNIGSIDLPLKSIQNAVNKLLPGDTAVVRGGIYREAVTFQQRKINGTAENRITIRAYEGENPILDGSMQLTNWTRCNEDCEDLKSGGVVNPHYSNIFWTEIHKDNLPLNPEAMIVFEKGEYLYLAQEPNQINNADDIIQVSAYMTPITEESVGMIDGLIDSSNLRQSDDYWNGARVIYKTTYSNILVYFDVVDFIAEEHKLIFGALLKEADRSKLGDRYSIANHPAVLNTPGEFFRSALSANDTYKIYIWPREESSLTDSISMSALGRGFYAVDNADYVTIDGFEIRNYAGNGIHMRADTGNPVYSVIIRNCNVHHNGGGGISLTRQLGSKIINCRTIYNTGEGGRGIHMGGEDLLIENCYSSRNRSTSISFYGVTNGRMINNVVGYGGVHSNCLRSGVNSKNILMAGNKIFSKGNIGFAIKDTENIYIVNNECYGGSMQSQGGNTGDYVMLNNTIMPGISNKTTGRCILKNNIIDGGGDHDADRTHNIYTILLWSQYGKYGWSFGEGEIGPTDESGNPRSYAENKKYELNRSEIFKIWDLDSTPPYDFHLKEGSIAISAGENLSSLIKELKLEERFPDYNFQSDIEGNLRPATGPWDIGAYQFKSYEAMRENELNEFVVNKSVAVYNNIIAPGKNKCAELVVNVKTEGRVSVIIYNTKGSIVKTVFDGAVSAGELKFNWYGTNESDNRVGSGVYIVHFTGPGINETKKIVVVK